MGDCRQETVFIGQGIDRDRLVAELSAACSTVAEIEQGTQQWSRLPDPLGAGATA